MIKNFFQNTQQTLIKVVRRNPLFYILLILEAEKKRLQILQTEGKPILLVLETYFPYEALKYRNLSAKKKNPFSRSLFAGKIVLSSLGIFSSKDLRFKEEELRLCLEKPHLKVESRDIFPQERLVLEMLIDIEYSIILLEYYSKIISSLLFLSFFSFLSCH